MLRIVLAVIGLILLALDGLAKYDTSRLYSDGWCVFFRLPWNSGAQHSLVVVGLFVNQILARWRPRGRPVEGEER